MSLTLRAFDVNSEAFVTAELEHPRGNYPHEGTSFIGKPLSAVAALVVMSR